MTVALLGGSFDPVHIGHLHIAEEVLCSTGVDRVFLVPAGRPPHKRLSGGAPASARLEMLRESIRHRSRFEVLDWELDSDGPSYTINTVRRLSSHYALNSEPRLVVGEDLVMDFMSWEDADSLLDLCRLVVARRPDGVEHDRASVRRVLDGLPHDAGERAVFVDNVPIAVSSSLVRERVSTRRAFRDLIPAAAFSVIERDRLYGFGAHGSER